VHGDGQAAVFRVQPRCVANIQFLRGVDLPLVSLDLIEAGRVGGDINDDE